MNKKTKILFILCLCMAVFTLVACGNREQENNPDEVPADSSYENTTDPASTEDSSMTEDTSSLGEDIMNGAEDIVDGAENAVEDITGIDFTDYQKSHDYLLDKIAGKEGNDNGRYIVREEENNPVNYDTDQPDKKGYRYEVYDTTSDADDAYGVFYVDHETGDIFRENDDTEQIEKFNSEN